jgi:ABC-type proline/glycine betaine transport system ATPase subunit
VFRDHPKHDIAMIFQDYAVFPWMTVLQNVVFALKLRNAGRRSGGRNIGDKTGPAKLKTREIEEKALV